MDPENAQRLLQKMRATVESVDEQADFRRLQEIRESEGCHSDEDAVEQLIYEKSPQSSDAPERSAGTLYGGTGRRAAKDSAKPYLSTLELKSLLTGMKNGDPRATRSLAAYVYSRVREVVKRRFVVEGNADDLVAVGFSAVFEAFHKFDERTVIHLGSYIQAIIVRAINNELSNQQAPYQLPRHIRDDIKRLRKAELKLESELYRAPTNTELCTELNWTSCKVRQLQRLSCSTTISLNNPVYDDDGNSMVEEVVYENSVDPDQAILIEQLQELFSTELTKNEQDVLRYHFEDDLSLFEVGLKMNITKQRVQQIKESAIRKLQKKLFIKLI